MKKSTLLTALRCLSKNSRSYIHFHPNQLIFESNDFYSSIYLSHDLSGIVEFNLPILLNLVKLEPSDNIDFTVSEKGYSIGGHFYNWVGELDSIATSENVFNNSAIKLDTDISEFMSAFKALYANAPIKDDREYLNSVALIIQPDTSFMDLVTTNGHWVLKHKLPLNTPITDTELSKCSCMNNCTSIYCSIIPKTPLKDFLKVKWSEVYVSETSFVLISEDVKMCIPLIDYRYPDVYQVIPRRFKGNFNVPVKIFEEIFNKIEGQKPLYKAEGIPIKYNHVLFDLVDKDLNLTVQLADHFEAPQSFTFTTRVTLPVAFDVNDHFTSKVNREYLEMIVKWLCNKNSTMLFNVGSGTDAIICRCNDTPNKIAVLMPMHK